MNNQPENFKNLKKSAVVITNQSKEELSYILNPNRKIS